VTRIILMIYLES